MQVTSVNRLAVLTRPFVQERSAPLNGIDIPPGGNVRPTTPLEDCAAVEHSLRAIAGPDVVVTCRLASGESTILGTSAGLFRYISGGVQRIDLPVRKQRSNGEWPSVTAIALASNGAFWVGTDRGLVLVSGCHRMLFDGADGLPCTDVTSLFAASDGALWVGTGQGLACLRNGEFRWYAGQRWLPDNRVTALGDDGESSPRVETPGGAIRVAGCPMTLEQKCAHYDRITQERHNRGGFIAPCRMEPPDPNGQFVYEANENDGLWTSLYIAAQCLRYAATGDPAARGLARQSMAALLDLCRVTGLPGYPARAMVRAGERVVRAEPAANWRTSPTMAGAEYLTDTSSDEIVGHYLAWYLFHELVADHEERERVSETCRAVTSHILDNGNMLVDAEGRRTSWGVWNPDLLNGDPRWAADRGLNSLEILSHLRVAIALCGESRFEAAYCDLIERHGYALNTIRQKVLPPEADDNHSDDQLASLSYYLLLSLEPEPALRSLYRSGLRRSWEILRPQGSPLHNFVYGAVTGEPCDAEAAIRALEEAPWDLRDWTMVNSAREDVRVAQQPGRFGELQGVVPLSARERRVARWNRNPYALDGGANGAVEEDGGAWLFAYWLSRRHGITVVDSA